MSICCNVASGTAAASRRVLSVELLITSYGPAGGSADASAGATHHSFRSPRQIWLMIRPYVRYQMAMSVILSPRLRIPRIDATTSGVNRAINPEPALTCLALLYARPGRPAEGALAGWTARVFCWCSRMSPTSIQSTHCARYTGIVHDVQTKPRPPVGKTSGRRSAQSLFFGCTSSSSRVKPSRKRQSRHRQPSHRPVIRRPCRASQTLPRRGH